jgi:GntR family transcriptional regulator, phosphonate transport system regulatory protein
MWQRLCRYALELTQSEALLASMTDEHDEPSRISLPALTPMRVTGVALWRQIAGTIHHEISSGLFAPGMRLPTEAELTARFDVNRHTVRRAMEDLESRGIIRVEQGRGSFVSEDVLYYPVGKRPRFTEAMNRLHRTSDARILKVEEIPADAPIAARLRIRKGGPVVLSKRLSVVDGRPVVVASHWFSAARFPGIAGILGEEPSITHILARFGIWDFHRERTDITARMPTAEEAELLEQPRTIPVLTTDAVNLCPKGEPLEVSRGCYAAGRVQLVAECD